MQVLTGHTSPETAFVVDDYPYGFRLRCKIRYWLEYKPKSGFRFVSQTTNPKVAGERWNKPKASTYCRFGGVMLQQDNGHIYWHGLSEYAGTAECEAFLTKYGVHLPADAHEFLRRLVAAKKAYDANREPGDALSKGLQEAREAFIKCE